MAQYSAARDKVVDTLVGQKTVPTQAAVVGAAVAWWTGSPRMGMFAGTVYYMGRRLLAPFA